MWSLMRIGVAVRELWMWMRFEGGMGETMKLMMMPLYAG